jgi:RNA polymerase sigma-70 factor, ECF subfamily
MARAAAGDRQAFRALVDGHVERLHRLGYRMLGSREEAEDVAQESFLRLYRALPDWQPGRARLSTWLYRVASNLCIDRLRKRREVALPEGYDAPDPDAHSDGGLGDRQVRERVRGAVDALPERQRLAILLSHYEGCGNPETAQILGVSVEAVESLLSRARRSLKQALAAELEDFK